MNDPILIYGATGFTGSLILREALARGLRPTIGGRSRQKVLAASHGTGLPHRWASLDDAPRVREMLDGIQVVVNVAGPFRATAPPLVSACIEAGIHYLDLTGEYASIEWVASQNERAKKRGAMLMPGVGFDIVATDCAAACAARSLPGASHLAIALTGLDAISRGSAHSVIYQYAELVMVRRNGQLTRIPPGELVADFDFGAGPKRATAVTWGDIASASFTTGIQNVTVFYEETTLVRLGLLASRYGQVLSGTPLLAAWQRMAIDMMATGPSSAQRAKGRAVVVARVTDSRDNCAEVRLETPEVYSFTAATAVAIAERVLAGELQPGFQTPARVFGPDFASMLPGVSHTRVK